MLSVLHRFYFFNSLGGVSPPLWRLVAVAIPNEKVNNCQEYCDRLKVDWHHIQQDQLQYKRSQVVSIRERKEFTPVHIVRFFGLGKTRDSTILVVLQFPTTGSCSQVEPPSNVT